MVKHVSIFALKDKSEIKHFVEMLEEVGKNYPLIIKSEIGVNMSEQLPVGPHFGDVIQMEIGALMVGKIVNHDIKKFKRGDEKGYFLFGGSTVVLLLKKDVVEIDSDIVLNSKLGIETKVKLGEVIGRRK